MSTSPTALITGITGQDGSFLAELLLERGYRVAGLVRGPSERSLGSSEHLRGQIEPIQGDLLDPASLRRAIETARPREIYHLAGPSFVPASTPASGVTGAEIGTTSAATACRNDASAADM